MTVIAHSLQKLRLRAWTAMAALMVACAGTAVALGNALESSITDPTLAAPSFASGLMFTLSAAASLSLAFAAWMRGSNLSDFRQAVNELQSALAAGSSDLVYQHLENVERLVGRTAAVKVASQHFSAEIERHLDRILQSETREKRSAAVETLCRVARSTCAERLAQERANTPMARAHQRLQGAIASLKQQREAAERELDLRREKKWLKLWFDLTRPDFAEVDGKIAELEVALRRLEESRAFAAEGRRYDILAARIEQRVSEIEQRAIEAIPTHRSTNFDEDRIIRNAIWLAAFSVPVSVWNDFSNAGDVYDALREVNGKYANLSDFDIWLQTLALPPDELAGLASLTKGAYFERLVESDFNGVRFEHFNHPDTDIMIDGVAYQVKATDSVSYVESVPDHIDVITTSEVAELTGAIDGGYFNADLTDTVDLALGGAVLDIGDTAADAILTGFGGVGILAILKGVWRGSAHYNETGDALAALGVSLQTVAVSTARTVVNAAEIAGRGTISVVRSRPVRFAGRVIATGAHRLDVWLSETAEKGDRPT